ncbi:TetR/AcrR family transcriptional regulator [Phytohabitans suffuscus]|uniref:TetR family transcriptional regulator n=1 Tax=Phytohabitans suffuscus TaxID=624315 RepID=A0A6F8YEQ4_9ACTN|nr:TetR/AcrR family transcriptional regulator [Phytohabitans suffuscus]BCB84582.1 TetR family transcriptional regulator [Phytohabitans suffuscus]
MTVAPSNSSEVPSSPARGSSLRERKKAKTRANIQQHALRLFRAQGYDATTIEQIAEAAEVSPSTVFRYFATKEDLVVADDTDLMFVAALRTQDPALSPVRALRQAIRVTIGAVPSAEFRARRDRDFLIVTVPELWAASLGNVTSSLQILTTLFAERMGLSPEHHSVRALSGAVFGIMFDTMLQWSKDPDLDLAGELDSLLAHLDQD